MHLVGGGVSPDQGTIARVAFDLLAPLVGPGKNLSGQAFEKAYDLVLQEIMKNPGYKGETGKKWQVKPDLKQRLEIVLALQKTPMVEALVGVAFGL